MKFNKYNQKNLNLVQILSIGFILIILIGGLLLWLPISSSQNNYTNFIDAIFTSTSAVCVTGLTTLNTSQHWSGFGKVIIALLIEIGSLGFASFFVIFSQLLGKKITLKNKLLVQESMNTFSVENIVEDIKSILLFSFSLQLLGGIILATQLIPEYGVKQGLFNSIFHSISAFCNSGIDLFESSLIDYNKNIVIIFVISLLIFIGSIGFPVILEILRNKDNKRLSIHSKLSLITTLILIVTGALLILLFEYNNELTLGKMEFEEKTLSSFFSSISLRTAGFYNINLIDMTNSSKFLVMILMFIGGSPGSTAGGLKTVTVSIIFLTLVSVVRGREDTECFGRRFTRDLIYKAFTIFFLGISLVILSTIILVYAYKEVDFLSIFFEVTAALSTAGSTLNLTPGLGNFGKIIIMILMYIGRLGPLTVILSLRKNDRNEKYKYPKGKILIG